MICNENIPAGLNLFLSGQCTNFRFFQAGLPLSNKIAAMLNEHCSYTTHTYIRNMHEHNFLAIFLGKAVS